MKSIDSSILQFVPKGSYYNTKEEQLQKIEKLWKDFLKYDRLIFTLSTLMNGTSYSKGRMAHLLLSTPVKYKEKELVKLGLDSNFENEVLLHNLRTDDMTRSLKNLIMLTGGKKDKETKKNVFKKVNNRNTVKLILRYLFERDEQSLEAMAISFKKKMKILLTHALGKQNVYNILNGDPVLYNKYIGKYNPNNCHILLCHLFDMDIKWEKITSFPKIKEYYDLRKIAESKNSNKFISFIKNSKLPLRTVIGFRNTFKLDVDLSEVYKKSKLSNKESIQLEKAASKTGTKLKVNYENNDIYDLWKTFYNKVLTNDNDNLDKISEVINKKSQNKLFGFGKSVVIFDSSGSMKGSDKRPLHPFLTGLCTISLLENIEKIFWVSGLKKKTNCKNVPVINIPFGKTSLWEHLIEAVKLKPKTIIVISDGYENSIKGLFQTVYTKLKESGEKINLVHINPVFSSEVSGARKLVDGIEPLVLNDYKFIETEFVFKCLATNRDNIKMLLSSKYKQLVSK